MKNLDEPFWQKASHHQAIVPVFTNVVFDTSQSHANVVFDHMFQWLDVVLEAIKSHPEILFVIRAHPDELRSGKESRETVAQWVDTNAVENLPNVIFIASDKYVSSYELIQHAKFVMVYNSTVGLEASILGKTVLCAGKARYTQIPTVFFPSSKTEYIKQLEKFLSAKETAHPEEFRENARRVLYSQLFRASLPYDAFLEEDGVWRGYVRLKDFSLEDLAPEKSSTIQVVLDGISQHKPFIREI
jgi:capsule polysaccharide modification protein KpsS